MSKLIILGDGYPLWADILSDVLQGENQIVNFPADCFTRWQAALVRFLKTNRLPARKIRTGILHVLERSVYRRRFGTHNRILLLNPALARADEFFLSQLKQNENKISVLWLDSVRNYGYLPLAESPFIDCVYSFDRQDCNVYGWRHTFRYYSVPQITENTSPKSDVFFCGYNKKRLPQLLALYDFLTSHGIHCLFYYGGATEEEQKNCRREHLVFNTQLSYGELTRLVAHTKIILDLVQDGQTGVSLRFFEAYCFGKGLLTNNPKPEDFDPLPALCSFSDVSGDAEKILAFCQSVISNPPITPPTENPYSPVGEF